MPVVIREASPLAPIVATVTNRAKMLQDRHLRLSALNPVREHMPVAKLEDGVLVRLATARVLEIPSPVTLWVGMQMLLGLSETAAVWATSLVTVVV